MNELDILFPSPVILQAGGELLPVMPLTLRQLPAMVRALEPLLPAFDLDGAAVDIDALMGEPGTVQLVSAGIERPHAWVAGLIEDERRAALLTLIGCNADFFFPLSVARDEPDPDRTDIADACQRLLAAGHRWQDVQGYTLAQMRLFDASADRLRREAERAALISARAAVLDGPAFRSLLNSLSPD